MKSIFKQIRKEKELTQDDLAAVLGTGRQTVYDLEHLNRQSINESILEKLKAIGYSPENVKKSYNEQRKEKQKDLIEKINY